MRHSYTPELLGMSAPAIGAWRVGRSTGEGVIVGILAEGGDAGGDLDDERVGGGQADRRGR